MCRGEAFSEKAMFMSNLTNMKMLRPYNYS